jgi:hypothetical protein
MTRLVQLQNGEARRVALVEEPRLRLLRAESVYEIAQDAIRRNEPLTSLMTHAASGETIDYDSVYTGASDWKLLTPIDHPQGPHRCLVSGTGLTHLGSARNRQSMHAAAAAAADASETDSMKMFRWGVEGGRPAPGQVGVAPEWFYKGNGTILRAHGEPLVVPPYALDGGEEAEIAGVYLIDGDGRPRRIGMAVGNEFSDHRFEKLNYLNLAGSKLRNCSLGPELAVDPAFDSVQGEVSIERDQTQVWSKQIRTGEAEMCHSLGNIEHHHFKFEPHRRPDDVHVHYFGACALSFGDGVELKDGDVMAIRFDGFGRSLRNPLRAARSATDAPVTVSPL